jgi:hypothetical protein
MPVCPGYRFMRRWGKLRYENNGKRWVVWVSTSNLACTIHLQRDTVVKTESM